MTMQHGFTEPAYRRTGPNSYVARCACDAKFSGSHREAREQMDAHLRHCELEEGVQIGTLALENAERLRHALSEYVGPSPLQEDDALLAFLDLQIAKYRKLIRDASESRVA